MNLPRRNRPLLPPESIGPDQGDQDRNTMTRHREGFARDVEFEAVARWLQAEELGDYDALHGDYDGGADVGEEGSFKGCSYGG
ncbi:hypothetical protein F1880_008867 [Penicillium rolfsii]|nr:hypothetical protein F1880_008867 [Penicillium rolfsii]